VSRFQEQRQVPVWEYHHLAEDTILGTDVLTRDSQYQIGSISKAITDAVLIRSGLSLDDPITKWLPGLGGSPSLIRWDSISLRQLASHMAGIPPNREFWIMPSSDFMKANC
jgi:CubicO group peptidase (beta-lactamase class C family)